MRVGAVLIVLILAWAGVRAVGSDAGTGTITLSRGWNVVTWNGAEPYAIDNFADTPVTGVHRWDAVGQQWLSHIVGRDGASLPELHLLPRVQYLLIAEATHELDVPDAVGSVDPRGELRFAALPDNPLRFDAYWPNEDSPLEDLVVLRGEGERLSVRAEVAGGVGDVSVWWMIDGRANHAGLASDDVDLAPGAHDHGRLYAVDVTGQIAIVKLPRVVKLPPLELPVMHYGVLAHIGTFFSNNFGDNAFKTHAEVAEAIGLMKEAGFTIAMSTFRWNSRGEGHLGHWWVDGLPRLDWVADELQQHRLEMIGIAFHVPKWAAAGNLTSDSWTDWGGNSWSDPRDKGDEMAWMAARWPSIRFWNVAHEANLHYEYSSLDPMALAAEIRAAALGAWYGNPDAVIVAPGLTPTETRADRWAHQEFLQALYDHGAGPYIDIVDVHPFQVWQGSIDESLTETRNIIQEVRTVMRANGDADKPIWATSVGMPTWGRGEQVGPKGSCSGFFVSPELQAALLVATYQMLTESEDVSGVLSYNFRDTGSEPDGDGCFDTMGMVWHELEGGKLVSKPSYWALREYLTGKPPPE